MACIFVYKDSREPTVSEERDEDAAVPAKGDTITRKDKTWTVESVVFTMTSHPPRNPQWQVDHLIVLTR
jgi:hypothetical protein